VRRTSWVHEACGVMAWVLALSGGPIVTPVAQASAPSRSGKGEADARAEAEGDAKVVEGDQAVDAGDHAAAARAYAQAHGSYAKRTTIGAPDVKEKQALSLALDELGLAQAAVPGSFELLEVELALLEEHERRMGGKLPAALAQERERVQGRIAELRAEETARDEHERREAEALKAEPAPEQSEPMVSEKGAATQGEPRVRKGGPAIVSAGAVSLAGGVAMLASGVWNLGNVRRRGDELLGTIADAEGGTPEMRDELRQEVEAWQTRWRGIGTGLSVGGAVLAATGVGLTVVGIVRMRQGKRVGGHAMVVGPVISGREVGVAVRGRW
jgi:hypothetical protein